MKSVAYLLISLFVTATSYSQIKPRQEKRMVIKEVTILPMTIPNKIINNATVLISGNRIVSINGTIPDDAEIIDGKGKWLIPGLIDMHVHVPSDFSIHPKLPTQAPDLLFDVQDLMTPYIATGVTTVCNLNADAGSFYQRSEIFRHKAIGPRMALAALINGGSGKGRRANTAEEGRQAVRDAQAEGYEFIKVYSDLNIATFQAIVAEAGRLQLKVIGHIPDAFQSKLEQAFVPHFDMVAHAEEFSKHAVDFSKEEAQRFALLAKENGTWLSPTLTTMVWIADQTRSLDGLQASPTLQYMHPLLQSKWLTANNYYKHTSPQRIAYFEQMLAFHLQLVKSFKEAGVPIVAGTDAGLSGVVGGFSLHDELELLVAAGLTPEEALASATRLPATWMGLENEMGSIEPGKLADLVLLDESPLEDIKNTRKIAGVFVDGQWLDRTTLDTMLADLSQRNTAAKDQFDWAKMMHK